MAKAEKQEQAAAAEATELSLLEQIVEEGRFGTEEAAKKRGRDMISAFVKDVLDETVTYSRDTEAMLNEQIRQIDELMSAQVNAIMHHEKFKKLEGSWRGLRYLVSQTEIGSQLKVKVMSITKDELSDDLTAGKAEMAVDRSTLFNKIYQQEFNQYGGDPYGSLIVDYEFDKIGPDMKLLTRLSQVGAAAHMPILSAASPKMFGFESYTELEGIYQLGPAFEGAEYAQWNAFRDSEDSRYVSLTCPRMLIREPYGKETKPARSFNFEEEVTGKEHDKYLWANAAWGLGARVTDAFARYGWCARIRGVRSGGLVEGLPTHTFKTDKGDIVPKCPTETLIPDDKEFELAELGFAPLLNEKNTANAVFFSVYSAQKPKEYVGGAKGDRATLNAKLSVQMPYIFAASRFAHYLKVMMRGEIGSYKDKNDLQMMLGNWIGDYVLKNASASEEQRAKKPLRDAQIKIVEDPRAPGRYEAKVELVPHFQLDAINFSLSLVGETAAE